MHNFIHWVFSLESLLSFIAGVFFYVLLMKKEKINNVSL